MAMSTIKFDEAGNPKRAKYRIVVLGNLDQHTWSKSETYAPVLSLIDLRTMSMLAIHHRRILKQDDFKQAFVQATLPPNEQYILKPPHGCPISEPNTYWLLTRTLYGLKRSAKHWYDKATQILADMGLRPTIDAPCIYHGKILPNLPDLYLGLYVDDFVYFSTSPEVETAFETKLKAATNVDFMGQVTHFLGHKFTWKQYNDEQNNPQLQLHLSQQAFAEQLVADAGLSDASHQPKTPYRSGFPVDSIPEPITTKDTPNLRDNLRSFVGSLNWLAQGTRPDLSTITAMLARYQNRPHKSHIDAAKYAIKYVPSIATQNH